MSTTGEVATTVAAPGVSFSKRRSYSYPTSPGTWSPSWNPVPSYTKLDAPCTTHACPNSTCSSYMVPTSASSSRLIGASR